MSLANRLQQWNRSRKVEQFFEACTVPGSTILDVGFGVVEIRGIENLLEKRIDDLSRVTALTIDDPSRADGLYPDLRIVQYDGTIFPFDDRSFDAVWSNAVIEHVGDMEARLRFVRESARVAPVAFLTTPNRWFPIESHTKLPLLHFLPKPLFDRVLRRLGKAWATGSYMHLMGRRELRHLMEASGVPDYHISSNRLGPFTMDFVVIIKS